MDILSSLASRLSSRRDRYLGMTAAMTQVPVPTAIVLLIGLFQEGELRGDAAWPTLIAGAFFISASIILTIIIKAKTRDNR